jgi:hypothetical protein
MRGYKERTMTLQNKLKGCLRAQGHEGIDLIFVGINALVLEISPLVCCWSYDK